MGGLRYWMLGTTCTALLAAPAAGAAVTREAVLHSRAYEIEPYVGDGHFAWAQASKSRPARFNVYARPDGGSRFKVNPSGSVAFATDVDGTTLVFSQRPRPAAPGDIQLYDLDGRTASVLPAGINTAHYSEGGGKLAGNFLLFGRQSRSAGKIFLFDLDVQKRTLLDSIPAPGYIQTGDVDGGLAAWIKCRRLTRCKTFVYDLAEGKTTRVPNPKRRSQYAVSLADDGTVYFAESTNINCGKSRAVWRWDMGGKRVRLFGLRRGRDIAVTTPVENLDGTTTIYYDRFNCKTGAADIFKATVEP